MNKTIKIALVGQPNVGKSMLINSISNSRLKVGNFSGVTVEKKEVIFKYKDYTQVQIFSAGTAVLDMKIYEDKVCRATFKCQDLATFNKENLSSTYPDNFLKELFERNQKEVIHRDKTNDILIKI